MGTVTGRIAIRWSVVLAYVLVVLVSAYAWRSNEQRINDINTASKAAAERICEATVGVRAEARRTDREQLQRNLDAYIPTAEELGITDITPGAVAYIQTLGASLIAGQIAYFEDRLERFPPLHCAERNDRVVAVPKS